MKKTACVILNYRSPEQVIPLVESVQRCRGENKAIYVVENGTGPEAVEFLKQRIGASSIVSTPVNLGFAGGMNLGIQQALEDGAEFVWLLAKDLTVEPDCLQKLHSTWEKLENPGLLGSLTDLNGSERIYFYRAIIDNRGRTRHGTKGRSISEIPELRREWGLTDYVNGSCIFTHRSVIEKIGLIPEEYFLYFEDCEWGLRATRAGYKNYVCYSSRVHHSREVGGFNRTAEYYCRRNAFLFKKRNGFARPWTKFIELWRIRKAILKSKFRQNHKMVEVLQAVKKDIEKEQFGLGPWR